MLVLSRQRDEEVVISLPGGGEIVVCVVDIRHDKVKLGFAAPDNVPVHRREVHEAILRERGKAELGKRKRPLPKVV